MRSFRIRMVALPLVVALCLTLTLYVQGASPFASRAAAAPASVPSGVEVQNVEWITDRQVNLYIKSKAMPEAPVKVQLLLARDWQTSPERSFPTLYALDGLLALPGESGWIRNTNIVGFFADKNVNVALPTDAMSSFYTDWEQPDNDRHYKWETFMTKELPGLLERDWRSNDQRGVFGISMGGTGAMNLMARNPEMYDFGGSFSGILDTTSYGMGEMIAAAMRNAGNYDAEKMWGKLRSENWKQHDPKLLEKALSGKTIYVSAGNGNVGPFVVDRSEQPPGMEKLSTGLESISRMTAVTFTNALESVKDVNVITQFRDSGTHDWPYWQYELTQAWPAIADTFGLSEADRGANCILEGAIGAAWTANERVGSCVTGEYVGPQDGRIQDFKKGRAYWSTETGAQFLWGLIGAKYTQLGGPNSWLGYPTSEEQTVPDGEGKFVTFQNGAVYFHPEYGTHPVSRDILAEWGNLGFEEGSLGYPVSDIQDFYSGLQQKFEHGVIIQTVDGKASALKGAIADKYMALDNPLETLGMPKTGEISLVNDGVVVKFDKGSIYWSPDTGAHIMMYGDIYDAWIGSGFENGPFGYPTTDLDKIPAGGLIQKFQGGEIRQENGAIKKEQR